MWLQLMKLIKDLFDFTVLEDTSEIDGSLCTNEVCFCTGACQGDPACQPTTKIWIDKNE